LIAGVVLVVSLVWAIQKDQSWIIEEGQTMKLTFFAICMALPSMLASQTAPKLEYVYEEHLGGGYTQSWSVILLGQSRDRVATDVYVVGDGKNGDFFGVIAVNCATPSRSRWLAVGGVINSEQVPSQTIAALRDMACAG
jgi:hypothetical protein